MTTGVRIRYIRGIIYNDGVNVARIKRFVPQLLSEIFPEEVAEFKTQDELLEIHFVKTFRFDMNGKPDRYFYRYVLDGDKLMVETTKGFLSMVGSITGNHNLTLHKVGK